MSFLRAVCTAVVLLGAVAAKVPALADDYPSRPIRFVVPYAPGGGADISARIVAEKMSEILGQRIFIENRAGAGGNIAAGFVAKADPDGYTLLEATPVQGINRALYRDLTYDNLKDFTPVGMFGLATFALAVTSSVPATTVQEFIAYAKDQAAQQKPAHYSSAGVGSPSHLAMELFKNITGASLEHVPYKGSGQFVIDIVTGTVQASFLNLPTALPLMEEKQVTVLGVSSAARSPLAPNLPTVAEQGVPNFEASTWWGILVPSATPKPIVDKLTAALTQAARDPGVRAKLLETGVEPQDLTGEQFGAYIKSETEKWGKVVAISGAKVN